MEDPHLAAVIGALAEEPAREIAFDVPLRCRLGRFMLRSLSQFPLSHDNTLSVRACEVVSADRRRTLGTVVVKTVARLPGKHGRLLPPEARFYQEIGPRLAIPQLHIPALYAVRASPAGHTQLFIEHLGALGTIESLEDMYRAARTLGRFAGHCHAARLHEADWLPRGVMVPALHQIVAFDELLSGLPVGEEVRADILEGFRQFLDRIGDINDAQAREPPTLCHGDLYQLNLFAWGDGFAAIDWGQVNAGCIGDDLGKLAFQWVRPALPEAEELEERLIAAYVEGAAPFVRADPSQSIRRAFRRRSVFTSLCKSNLYWRWVTSAPNPALRRRRLRFLARHFQRMALRAGQAVRELGRESGMAMAALA